MRAARPTTAPDTTFAYFRPLIVPALVAFAIAIRLWHVRHGLPDFLEEAAPLRLALGLRDVTSGTIDWNPHAFGDPSFAVYLHFFVQQLVYVVGRGLGHWSTYADYRTLFGVDPSAMVIAARLVGIACDALTVVAAMRIGRRFGHEVSIIAGMLVACAPALVATSRSVFADSVMTACALGALERMLAWHDRRGMYRLAAAATLTGLAAGTQYPATVLLVPLAWLAFAGARRDGRSGLAAAGAACAIAVAAFIASTPFAVLDFGSFVHDFALEGQRISQSGLGGLGSGFFGAHAAPIARNLGSLTAAFVVCSLGFVLADPQRRHTALVLWLVLVGFGLMLSLARTDAGLPSIVIAAVLGAAALRAAVDPFRRSVRRALLVTLLAACVGPTVFAGLHAASAGADTTQLQARRWCERALRPDEVIVQEAYSARLISEQEVVATRRSPAFRHASADVQSRVLAMPTFPAIELPLAGAGRITNPLVVPGRTPREVEVFARAAELNGVFYDPRLFAAADYVMTSGAVRDRFEAEPRRYAAQCGLYRLLDATGEVVALFRPRDATEGPEIVVYRIGSRYRAAVEALGPLDPLWWTAGVPNGYRGLATRALAPPAPVAAAELASAPAPDAVAAHTSAQGDSTLARRIATTSNPTVSADTTDALDPARARRTRTPAWVGSLTPLYDDRIREFAAQMGAALNAAGRPYAAARFALATLAMHPGDEAACLVYSRCAREIGDYERARIAIERTLAAHEPGTGRPADPALRLEYALVLEGLGAHDAAQVELEALASISDPRYEVAIEARRLLAAEDQVGGQ